MASRGSSAPEGRPPAGGRSTPSVSARLAREITTVGHLDEGAHIFVIGDPALSQAVARRGMEVCCADASVTTIADGRHTDRDGRLLWLVQSLDRMAVRAQVWDAVVVGCPLSDVAEPVPTLRRCAELLAPRGSLMVHHQSHAQLAEMIEYQFLPMALDLAVSRSPDAPQVRAWLGEAGCVRARTNEIQGRAVETALERVQRVHRKGLWPLALIPEDEFQRGLTALEEHAAFVPDDPELLVEEHALTYARKPSPRKR